MKVVFFTNIGVVFVAMTIFRSFGQKGRGGVGAAVSGFVGVGFFGVYGRVGVQG